MFFDPQATRISGALGPIPIFGSEIGRARGTHDKIRFTDARVVCTP